ncbi:MAG: hypothetical protein JNM19_14940 [Chitinophagaceae bacterium]|nr:hypothetical protein [Chitinophagaceae bacterium]
MIQAKYFINTCIAIAVCSTVMAQVQVSKEPLHRPVAENQFLRLLDVWLQPRDTTQFHIHSTPSLFLYLTSGKVSSQIKGGTWTTEQAEAGKSWFRSFSPDTLVHRVANGDTIPFHVTDLEILSSYAPGRSIAPLPFDILFENEKAIAYRLGSADLTGEIIQDRGPLLAQLVTGEGVLFHDVPSDEKKQLTQGQFVFIRPGTYFSFRPVGAGKIDLVLFEIR